MPDLLAPQALATGERFMDRRKTDHHLSWAPLARYAFQTLSVPSATFGR